MWDALVNLYKSRTHNNKMMLSKKLHNTRMAKGESVASYLTKVTQVRDKMAVVGENVPKSNLVCIALRGFTKRRTCS